MKSLLQRRLRSGTVELTTLSANRRKSGAPGERDQAMNKANFVYAAIIGALFALEVAYVAQQWAPRSPEAAVAGTPATEPPPVADAAAPAGAAAQAAADVQPPAAEPQAPAPVVALSPSSAPSGPQGRDVDSKLVDALISRYQETVSLAEIVKLKGSNPELRRLADGVIESRKRDLASLQKFRAVGN